MNAESQNSQRKSIDPRPHVFIRSGVVNKSNAWAVIAAELSKVERKAQGEKS